MLQRPDLEGDDFFWKGGPVGVLLIHGFTATTAEVRPLAKLLIQVGYTVSGPLLPGHGASPHDLNRVSWRDWVDKVEDSYQRLLSECEYIVAGGESTGGLLSLYLAIQHPETLALLLYAPALRLNLNSIDKLIFKLLSPFVPWVPKKRTDDEMAWQGYWVNPLKGLDQLFKLQKIVKADLDKIIQPVLIIQGEKDQTVSSDVPDQIINGIRSEVKEVHWMPESSHCVILDREFDQVGRITLNFLTSVLNPTKE